MKRFLCGMFLCSVIAAVSAGFCTVGAADASTMPTEQEIINVVGVLEIMNGDNYGNLNLDNKVTRAEFTKMALSTSRLKSEINTGTNISPFVDVRASHWAVGYVTTAVKNGYLKGYLDGTFKPDNSVTLEEAVTVMLRIMGYSELDSGKYPDTQLAKYAELDMDNFITAQRGQALTRRECMYLMYNALCSKDKSGGIYCQSLGYSTDYNGRIDYFALMSSKMEGPFVAMGADDIRAKVPFELEKASIIYKQKKISPADIKKYDVYYYSDKAKTVEIYRDTAIGMVNAVNVTGVNRVSTDYTGAPAAFGCVILGKTTYKLGGSDAVRKFSNYGELSVDDFVMLVLDREGAAADAVPVTDEIYKEYVDEDDDTVELYYSAFKGPYVFKDMESLEAKLPFDVKSAKIYHGTKLTDADYFRTNDVYYYSASLGRIDIHRDTATGFVKAITPSREAPAAVTVGASNYALANADIKKQFSSTGEYDTDDFVTLLLGRDGTAVAAIDGDIFDYAENNDDDVNYADLVLASMKGPVIVDKDGKWQDELPFDIKDVTVYKKNERSDADSIKEYDVLYYSQSLKAVWVYSDKATGVIENIAPNRISPSSVIVSGKTYALENTKVSFALSNLGTFKTGDTVTVLLGKNGGVVEIVAGSALADTTYGFVTGFADKQYTRPNGTVYTAETVMIMGIDTENYSYEHEDDYFDKGDFVSVSYEGDKAVIRKASGGVSASQADNINKLIVQGAFADDALILDVEIVSGDKNTLENKAVKYVKVFGSRLSGARLSTYDIYHAEVEDGRIKTLILKNFTGDMYTYGLIMGERDGGEIEYNMITQATETRISVSPGYNTPAMGPAKFNLRADRYIVTALESIVVDKDGFERAYCVSDGKVYNYGSSVEYYIKKGIRDYENSTYDDIAGGNYTIKAYYDEPETSGGRVRVIVAE